MSERVCNFRRKCQKLDVYCLYPLKALPECYFQKQSVFGGETCSCLLDLAPGESSSSFRCPFISPDIIATNDSDKVSAVKLSDPRPVVFQLLCDFKSRK